MLESYTKENISFALIGCGKIGVRHAAHIAKRARLTAVCDIDESRACLLAKNYTATAYVSLTEMLQRERPDVVAVCTPNGLHTAHSLAALKTGSHVVCEKPMALSTEDCHQMLAAANDAGKRLFVVKQNRYNNAVQQVKQLLDAGRLGRIYSFQINAFWNRTEAYYTNSWHGSRNLDGGTLFTQFSHFIDILYWLLGDVATVQACLKNTAHQHLIEIEDTGTVILNMKSGAIGTLHYTVNSFAKNMEGSITLFGEKGTVKIGGEYLNIIAYQNIDNVRLPPATMLPANDYGSYKGSMSNHDKVYDNVLQVLCHNGAMDIQAEDGLKTVEIIEKIYAANNCDIST